MRPVVKPVPGETVLFRNSNKDNIEIVVQEEYPKWSDAKDPLVASIGLFCSYCENDKDIEDLHVEHVSPKSRGGSPSAWDNFLLCCTVCNSVKSIKNISPADCHFPHLNNTYLSFIYDSAGRVNINPVLTGLSKTKAEKLYEALKLGRYPHTNECPTDRDYRWKNRYEAWNEAENFLLKYKHGVIEPPEIISRAKDKGCWSVWFTVFKGCDEVRRALIDGFEGTCAACFDSSNNYEPVPRNPGEEDDV